MDDALTAPLRRLPLRDLHLSRGARLVPFAGWEMPVQYEPGVMAEHLHTRASASLFDVSHMGQVLLRPRNGLEHLALALEALVPADILGLPEGRQRYGLLTDDSGGIRDDIMVTNRGDHLLVVVNASMRDADLAHLRDGLGQTEVQEVTDRALLALQGPASEAALATLVPGVATMRFMEARVAPWQGSELWISRSGYTGEDGFEISIPSVAAEAFAMAVLGQPGVLPAGLGARDSLRLEAGLPLYGNDIDRTTSPVEAGLSWSIGKARRPGGARAGGFAGADRVLRQLELGARRVRVGLRPEGRQPMRAGTALIGPDGHVGHVTSGGFGPTLQAPVAMGYVDATLAAPGTDLTGEVRGRALPVKVAPLPFVPPSFKR
ncbi:Aminomethyltransferase (glycine cleavage system T protein) [Rubellimicrobium mesophilum DSM 19309]|uniref:aminomethyltransferase n=1 Tax=Rubellimicrobium mesophilum DSM 19309 TaxID=442562 RepID=A0A017HVU6_9RHOB|nr:glycine cleavage system aminomethyltransferase GcvT [Rubellimicrobium mesophilum]EYD77879.1 Aminomethyltransferase (glycine cleavage system T protein) [Rubellimicrobium mesophilum DSM 19309]